MLVVGFLPGSSGDLPRYCGRSGLLNGIPQGEQVDYRYGFLSRHFLSSSSVSNTQKKCGASVPLIRPDFA
jgi:hypothetical protein